MTKKVKERSGEPRKNRELRYEERLPLDWSMLAAVEAFKPL